MPREEHYLPQTNHKWQQVFFPNWSALHSPIMYGTSTIGYQWSHWNSEGYCRHVLATLWVLGLFGVLSGFDYTYHT